ncbi:hypothetical protein BJY04DRAFT_221179 [Aspergillus karnatakaensis]|uniref:uncharacterized protein n=1 Tax=Aspergillus karnatakaensis TaxID=1810916 RepID=UPI003CCD0C9A
MQYPWKALSAWAPFDIDALGLLTLLGAKEVDISVGRLARSKWLEYMPLLAGFVFAGDQFRAKQPTFTLYNVSSGIVTSNLTAWLTRWMQAQEFELSRSLVYWEVERVPRTQWGYIVAPVAISAIFNGFLLVMTILSGDWYGFTNGVAIVILILVRAYMLEANRNAINRAVSGARPLPTTFTGAIDEWSKKRLQDPKFPRPRQDSQQWRPEVVKILVVMPDSRAVTMFIPEHLLRGVFVTESPVHSPGLYRMVQWTGWVAFTVHVVTLGMAHLATQLYVIALTVIPTVLICYGFGCDDSRLQNGWNRLWSDSPEPYVYLAGSQLKATVFEWPEDMEFTKNDKGVMRRRCPDPVSREKRSTARQDLYAWLDLSSEEERSLWDWHLLPHKRGYDDSWWMVFNKKKRLIAEKPPNILALKMRIQGESEAVWARRMFPTGERDVEKGDKLKIMDYILIKCFETGLSTFRQMIKRYHLRHRWSLFPISYICDALDIYLPRRTENYSNLLHAERLFLLASKESGYLDSVLDLAAI